MTLSLAPVTLKEARRFVDAHHRHHKAPVGGLFAVGCRDELGLRGVAIVGRPVARLNQDGLTCEVTRLCSDGSPNVCSMLYSACWRAARALGWHRLITYTLASEPGTSLRAAGWRVVGEVQGRSWDRPKRGRVDKHPTTDKLLWAPLAS